MSPASRAPLPLPKYYTTLPPFADCFRTGLPILTYHKLGRRPRGARLKGLYLSAELFERQLAELRAGGFKSGSLDHLDKLARGEQIILTFDDGFQNVLRHGLGPLARSSFSAIQFLVAGRLGALNDWEIAEGEKPERLMDATQVREWLAAGHTIGSHTRTHPCLTRISHAQAVEEITASKKQLEDLFGHAVRHFCYPYGDFNAEIAELVAQAGYMTACTTRSGVNSSQTPPHQLLRFTARYPTRSIKSLKERLTRWKLFTF